MDRISGDTTVDIGAGKRGFQDEDLLGPVIGTDVTALFLNSVQEEVIGIIEGAGLEPSDADWGQLGKSVQSGRLNYAVAGGSATAITASLPLVPPSLGAGLTILLELSSDIAGATTLDLNGWGAVPLVAMGGDQLAPGDYMGGQILPVLFDQTIAYVCAPVARSIIDTAITKTVYGVGADFEDINAANLWLSRRRIASTGSVTLRLSAGQFTSAVTQRIDHPDGERITLAGQALTGGGFPAIGAFTVTGYGSAARAADTTANLAMLRGRFPTELQFTGSALLSIGRLAAASNILVYSTASGDGVLVTGGMSGSLSNIAVVGSAGRGVVAILSNYYLNNIVSCGCGATGVSIENAASVVITGPVIALSSGGNGFAAAGGGSVGIQSTGMIQAHGNAASGILATDSSVILRLGGTTGVANMNGGAGWHARRGSHLLVQQASASNNLSYGFLAEDRSEVEASNSTGASNGGGYGASNMSLMIQTGGSAGSLSPASNTTGNANSYMVS